MPADTSYARPLTSEHAFLMNEHERPARHERGSVAERRAIASYMRDVADMLGLIEWKLYLLGSKPEGLEADDAGYCSVVFGHKCASIWLGEIASAEPDWQRYVVVHELLHIPMQAPWWSWSRPVRDILGALAYDAITPNAVTAWEQTIDQLGRAIAALLPYPNWSATPSAEWIGDPDEGGDLVLYSRRYHETGLARPAS